MEADYEDDLAPQLRYERLGADGKCILRNASATCLCLSEKVLALGTSTGSIHILDYSGNEVKRSICIARPYATLAFMTRQSTPPVAAGKTTSRSVDCTQMRQTQIPVSSWIAHCSIVCEQGQRPGSHKGGSW